MKSHITSSLCLLLCLTARAALGYDVVFVCGANGALSSFDAHSGLALISTNSASPRVITTAGLPGGKLAMVLVGGTEVRVVNRTLERIEQRKFGSPVVGLIPYSTGGLGILRPALLTILDANLQEQNSARAKTLRSRDLISFWSDDSGVGALLRESTTGDTAGARQHICIGDSRLSQFTATGDVAPAKGLARMADGTWAIVRDMEAELLTPELKPICKCQFKSSMVAFAPLPITPGFATATADGAISIWCIKRSTTHPAVQATQDFGRVRALACLSNGDLLVGSAGGQLSRYQIIVRDDAASASGRLALMTETTQPYEIASICVAAAPE